MAMNKFLKGLTLFVVLVILIVIISYIIVNSNSRSSSDGSNELIGRIPLLESRVQDLESDSDWHKARLDSIEGASYDGDNSISVKIYNLERKVDALEWTQEELSWEVFQLSNDWVLDHADLCDQQSEIGKRACLNMLTNVYRSFISDDPQYCERIGDSDLRTVCLKDYDTDNYSYRDWYDSYFLDVEDIPTPVILDKAGLCDQNSLQITKQECLDMLTHVKNAIENSDISYCNNIQNSEDMKVACITGVENFDSYTEWYDYYFLGVGDPGIYS